MDSPGVALHLVLVAISGFLLPAAKPFDAVDRGTPRTISRVSCGRILTALYELVDTLYHETVVRPGDAFDDLEEIDNGKKVYLRLWYFDPARSGDDSCSTTPLLGPTHVGSDIVQDFKGMVDHLKNVANIEHWGYSYYTGVEGNLGIEYALEDAVDDRLSSSSDNATPEIPGDYHLSSSPVADCHPFRGGLGDCNLVLYDIKDNVKRAVWASGTFLAAKACYLRMQLDCNLVIYGKVMNVVKALWDTKTMVCKRCVVACSLVVQADRNVVVYNNRERKAVWATNSMFT
ncbi:hypothetical protein SELMODRAFT_417909 [Selaginella moellendorffii]|uniref:Bulb-type lectin domain-containing protein n=1 Tax=Selaginella moellendorffii TaxID=88036 RepID=D8S419_SELML|nr:hypothetical protein SELMODRAFT_417909 [Selaginella moellendorffii]